MKKIAFENIVGKTENTGNQHFLLFSTMLSTEGQTYLMFIMIFNLSSANAFDSDNAKILLSGKGLRNI